MKLLPPLAALSLSLACSSTSGRVAPGGSMPAGAGAFRVAVFGDMPYHTESDPKADSIMAAYGAVLDTISKSDVAFVVHIGDITQSTCTDSVYARRLREFSGVPHPVVYTFGDNEWTDCAESGRDPLERLAKLREVFARGGTSLGLRPMPLERQGADGRFARFGENVRWTRGGVVFLTLHVTGSNNNRGRDTLAPPPAEFVERNAANLAWLRDGFAAAERDRARGVAVFMQANPRLDAPGGRWARRPKPDGFAELLDELQQLSEAFGRPVALVHGDTHYFRVDQPFTRRGSYQVITNITRAETYGNPNFHALLMTVDPASANLFRFEPLIVPGNALR